MSVRIRRLAVRGFGPLADFVLEPGDLTVVHGENEAGKTSCIDALVRALRDRVRAGNRKMVDQLRDGPGFDGEVDLELDPADGGPLVALLRDHPSLARLFVVRDGDAALESGRTWLNAIRGRLTGIDLTRVADRVRAGAGLAPSGLPRAARAEERDRTEARLGRVKAFLGDLPGIDRLSDEVAQLERQRTVQRTRVARLRAAERFERYRTARAALDADVAARTRAADLAGLDAEDLAEWREAVSALREAAALSKTAEQASHRLDEQLEEEASQLRVREALLENALALAAECARRDLPARVAAALADRDSSRRWAARRMPLAMLALLLPLAACALGMLARMPAVAPHALVAGVAAGAAASAGAIALVLLSIAGLRIRAASDVASRVIAECNSLLLDVASLDACQVRLAGVDSGSRTTAAERAAAADRRRATEGRLEAARLIEAGRIRALDAAQARVGAVRARTGLASLDELERGVRARTEAEAAVREARRALINLVGEDADPAAVVATLESPDPGVPVDAPGLLAAEAELTRLEERSVHLRGLLSDRRDRAIAAIGLVDLSAAEGERDRLAESLETIDRETRAGQLCLQALRELSLDIDQPLREALGSGPGAAGETLCRLTGGRYVAVQPDGDGRIAVQRRDGSRLTGDLLSRGARDQFALAVRLALVRRLVGEPAFLVLDDAFLGSDLPRREALTQAVAELAAEGWQVIYFTFDDRMRDCFAALGARVVGLGRRTPAEPESVRLLAVS